MFNPVLIMCIACGAGIIGCWSLYYLPIMVQGYIFAAISFLFALMDTFYATLISRTNILVGIKVFSVDEYHNICDNVNDFQTRLLGFWMVGKVLQLILVGISVVEIRHEAPPGGIKWVGYFVFVGLMLILGRLMNTYIGREREIFSVHKRARVLENEKHLEIERTCGD